MTVNSTQNNIGLTPSLNETKLRTLPQRGSGHNYASCSIEKINEQTLLLHLESRSQTCHIYESKDSDLTQAGKFVPLTDQSQLICGGRIMPLTRIKISDLDESKWSASKEYEDSNQMKLIDFTVSTTNKIIGFVRIKGTTESRIIFWNKEGVLEKHFKLPQMVTGQKIITHDGNIAILDFFKKTVYYKRLLPKQIWTGLEVVNGFALDSIKFSEDGKALIAGSATGELTAMSLRRNEPRFIVVNQEYGAVKTIISIGTRVLTGTREGYVFSYSLNSGRKLFKIPPITSGDAVMRLIPKGDKLVISHRSGMVRVYDMSTKAITHVQTKGQGRAIVVDDDGKTIVCSGSGELYQYQLNLS